MLNHQVSSFEKKQLNKEVIENKRLSAEYYTKAAYAIGNTANIDNINDNELYRYNNNLAIEYDNLATVHSNSKIGNTKKDGIIIIRKKAIEKYNQAIEKYNQAIALVTPENENQVIFAKAKQAELLNYAAVQLNLQAHELEKKQPNQRVTENRKLSAQYYEKAANEINDNEDANNIDDNKLYFYNRELAAQHHGLASAHHNNTIDQTKKDEIIIAREESIKKYNQALGLVTTENGNQVTDANRVKAAALNYAAAMLNAQANELEKYKPNDDVIQNKKLSAECYEKAAKAINGNKDANNINDNELYRYNKNLAIEYDNLAKVHSNSKIDETKKDEIIIIRQRAIEKYNQAIEKYKQALELVTSENENQVIFAKAKQAELLNYEAVRLHHQANEFEKEEPNKRVIENNKLSAEYYEKAAEAIKDNEDINSINDNELYRYNNSLAIEHSNLANTHSNSKIDETKKDEIIIAREESIKKYKEALALVTAINGAEVTDENKAQAAALNLAARELSVKADKLETV